MTRPVSSLMRLLAALLLVAGASPLGAQYTTVPEPAAYALRNVTVVAADGRRTSNVNVIVRNGIIEAIGPAAAIPAGVRLLDGDSLLVYPGLIDAQGKGAFDFAEPEVNRAQVASWDAPRVLQGYTPHRRVASALTATGKDFVEQRQGGIVAAAVHPEPALIAGQGAVLVLRPHATLPAQLVVNPSIGVLMGLRGGRGVYPGTMYGTTAFLRQALLDARRADAVQASYARDARGMAMPVADPDLQALQQMLREQRVFFVANTAEEIRFAVELGEQHDFTPTIVGGAEAWKVADLLRRRNVPVLVSVDYGRPRRWRLPSEGGDPPTRGERTDSAQQVPRGAESEDAAIRREQREFEERYANAGKLAAAGVKFALVSNAGRANLREGARTAIRYGLSEADALRALTATPAELLGLGRLATLAPGAPATFIVTDKPLFERSARVVYTLVDGTLERGRPASARADTSTTAARGGGTRTAGAADAGVAAGRYAVELTSAQGTLSGTMTLTGTDDAFSGSIDTEVGQIAIRNGRMEGQAMHFTMVLSFMQNMEMPVELTLQDGVLSGASSTPMGEARFSGRKLDPQARERERAADVYDFDAGHDHGGPHDPGRANESQFEQEIR